MIFNGKSIKYGDNVDTDVIIPARYLNTSDKAELASHCMEDIDKNFKNKVDSSTRGGAPLLGIAKPVIKAHGNSNPVAFKNAIDQARIFVETDVNGTISAALAKMKEEAAE